LARVFQAASRRTPPMHQSLFVFPLESLAYPPSPLQPSKSTTRATRNAKGRAAEQLRIGLMQARGVLTSAKNKQPWKRSARTISARTKIFGRAQALLPRAVAHCQPALRQWVLSIRPVCRLRHLDQRRVRSAACLLFDGCWLSWVVQHPAHAGQLLCKLTFIIFSQGGSVE
jgi:hypothetical protein